MTAICITGLRRETVEEAARLLQEAGMQPASTPEHARSLDVHAWHAQVVARVGQDPANLRTPGRLWEQLAADILVANLSSPCWGWAEPLSVPLLNFWRAFEPQMRFVLVCETLDELVARHLREQRSASELSPAINRWHEKHEAILRFHLRHAQASQLVWARTLQVEGPQQVARWQSLWGLPLNASGGSGRSAPIPHAPSSDNPLLVHLAGQLLERYPASLALAAELAACVPDSTLPRHAAPQGLPVVDTLITGLHALLEQAKLHASQDEQERAQARTAALVEQARQQASDKQAKSQQAFNQRLAEQAQESGRLLSQLHQTQEELERHIRSSAEIKTQLEAAMTAGAAAQAACDRELQAQKLLRTEYDQIVKASAKAAAAKKDAEEENGLLLQQLHLVQEELERTARSSAEIKAQLEGATVAKAAAEAACDRELKARRQLRKEYDQIVKTHTEAAAAKKDAEEENGLLLQQLYQVQEELERQFLDNQSAQLRIEQLQANLDRVMKSVPGACDCESLELSPGGNSTSGWRWVAKGVTSAGHRLDTLEFDTSIEEGVLGVTVHRHPGKAAPLLRWPLSAHGETQLNLIPLKTEKVGNKHLTLLAQLSSSDWDMTQTLIRQMLRVLTQGKTQLPAADQSSLVRATANTLGLMRPLQDILRFDSSKLSGQDVTDTREVLALQLTHMNCMGQRIAEFNFQFQAQPLLLTPGADPSGTAYLIFGRETFTAPFEAWSANAKVSGSQPVMAVPVSSGGPAAEVWDLLTTADRAFITGLIDTLPVALALLHGQKTTLSRSWKEWIQLATTMRQWVRQAPTLSLKPALNSPAPAVEAAPAKGRRKAPAGPRAKALPKEVQRKKPARPRVKAKATPRAASKATKSKRGAK